MAERIYLIDGMSQVYRAYHAIRGLTNKHGLPTNAVYGFTTMLRKLVQDEKPRYLAVAMEGRGRSFRHQQFQDYKSNRAPMPPDLKEQLPYIAKICAALKVPIISFENYEADDVIGSLSKQAEERGLEVVIVTIDKDMFQLVTDSTKVLDPRSFTLLDSEAVGGKLGIAPEQVIDYMSLVGDASDNIPGAPGIGAKGAQKLIQDYGSLERLFECSSEISRKSYRESLQNHREQILSSRDLVTIQRDLEVELDLENLQVSEPDLPAVFELFSELGFKSLIDELGELPHEGESVEIESIDESSGLIELESNLAGKQAAAVLLLDRIAISFKPNQATCLSEQLSAGLASDERAPIWSKPSGWIFHDLKALHLNPRTRFLGLVDVPMRDVMLMGYLLEPNQNDFSLETLTREHLHRSIQRGGDLFEEEAQRLADRASAIFQLHDKLLPQIREKGMEPLLTEIEMPLVKVLADMQLQGVRIDEDFFGRMSEEMGAEIERLSVRIFEIAGQEFNINSPKQMAKILFEDLQLPIQKKTRKAGHYSTGVEVLEKLADQEYEIAQRILEYREVSKLKSTYLDALPNLVDPETKRIHTDYNQVVAATGRLSSSNPNLQNIPIKSEQGRRIRKGFIPEEGFRMLSADYSQIELRVMAHLSEDTVLLESFLKGEDIHERTAREVFGMHAVMDPQRFRRNAKVINFGIMYGLSAFGLAQTLKIERKEAQRYIDDYFVKYSGVRSWIDKTLEEVRENGEVKTLFGRIRQIPEIHSKNWNLRGFGERTAINAPIQGTAADLIKMAMVSIHEEIGKRGLKSRMIMQVHDELVFEVAEPEADEMRALVVEHMEGAAELRVPLRVDVASGPTWYDAK